MSDIWFTADTHFGHTGILRYHPERGATLDEMHERLVTNWNTHVKRGDIVWHLGDFAMGHLDDSLRFFHRLNGSKHLVRGNHDGNRTVKKLQWGSVTEGFRTFRQKPHSAVLCHYPMLTWNAAHYGRWMLHGHSHGLLRPDTAPTTRLDVGVDCHPEMRPFHLDEIAAIMAERSYVAVDAHVPNPEKVAS